MPLTLLAILAAQTLVPTNGPAWPLSFLEGEEPHSINVTEAWAGGCYAVRFEFRVSRTVSQLAAQVKKELGVAVDVRPAHSSFSLSRTMNGVRQHISANSRTLGGTETQGGNVATVYVTEYVEVGARPLAFFNAAIAPIPPAPMIELPFAKGTYTHGVSFASLAELMSGKGIMQPGKDVRVYTAVLPDEAKFQQWAKDNGYKENSMPRSWFKAGVKLFEIYVDQEGDRKTLRMYWTEKKVTRPIVWEKI